MAEGVRQVAALADPVGQISDGKIALGHSPQQDACSSGRGGDYL